MGRFWRSFWVGVSSLWVSLSMCLWVVAQHLVRGLHPQNRRCAQVASARSILLAVSASQPHQLGGPRSAHNLDGGVSGSTAGNRFEISKVHNPARVCRT